MKSLQNKIAKIVNEISDLRHNLFFQSLPKEEREKVYKAKEYLLEVHQELLIKTLKKQK